MSETSSPVLVSFCVPTYNRARYLDSLLASLTTELAGFPFRYEVFVADNASTDATPQVVARHSDTLPLRYHRHEENRGAFANVQYLHAQAQGSYIVYIADDDGILGERVAQIIERMEREPEIGVAFAPWLLLNLVHDRVEGQFYRQDCDVLVDKGDHVQLLNALLGYRVFPEIYICRKTVALAAMARQPEQAFFAFVNAAEFVTHCAVLFLKDPYYVFVTQYFADDVRAQAGNQEAEYAWDRYRGGLEHVLGRAADRLPPDALPQYWKGIQDMIAERIGVAVRLRLHARRDPVETYYLAYRLKALGRLDRLPAPLDTLRTLAAIAFLQNDPELNRGMRQLACLGHFDADLASTLREGAKIPVSFGNAVQDLPGLDETTLLFVRDAELAQALGEAGGACVVTEAQLLRKFPG